MAKAGSYSQDPTSSDRDWVRWRIGDTDDTDWLQSDPEIDAALADEGDKLMAASRCASAIAAYFSRQADKMLGRTMRIMASQRSAAFRKLADDLEAQAASHVLISVPAESQSQKDSVNSDSDAVQPFFRRNSDDFPANLPPYDLPESS